MANQKEEIKSLVAESKPQQAHIKLGEFIESHSTLDNYLYAEKIYEQLSKELKFRTFKIAILRSITIEPMLPFLKVKCFENKINPELYLGDYNIIDQEILNKNSGLYNFKPEVLIVFTRLEEMSPRLVDSYLQLSSEEIEAETENLLAKIENLVSTFRENPKAKMILHNFELPEFLVFGIIDNQHKRGQKRVFEKINAGLVEIVNKYENVYLLDYEHLVSLYGKKNWFDEKLWYMAKAPISRAGLEALADEYHKYFRAMLGLTKKCLVLDLDNTLWGGILGEEGIEGIKLGHTSPGNAFMDFQRELLNLYQKGFILAINSKNNEENVMEVFDNHPDMVLRKEHFASIKINWTDKVQNMKDIAKELNIDMNTFVFFDDSPVERELIKQQLPEIHTVELPNNPHLYSRILKELPDFERLSFSGEDMKRGEMYRAQVQRKTLEKSSTSLEDFYTSLEMEAIIKKDDNFSIPRLAQMTQKTNQFNLTTIRYSESDITNFVASNGYCVYSLELLDKFGDNGIVGEIIIKEYDDVWEIDSFLLSCRVMGRTVETAFLSYIIAEGRKANVKNIVGKYIPTKKNPPVKDLYNDHGFELVKEDAGTTIWKLEIEESSIKCPGWIKSITKE
jgi:FkbH-like protein